MLKALPTDEELKETRCSDAGIFLQRLQARTLPEDFGIAAVYGSSQSGKTTFREFRAPSIS